MTIKEIVDETVEHYSKDPRRRASNDGDCFYLLGKKKCAVGRCMTPKARTKYAEFVGGATDLHFDAGGIDNVLPPRYRGHPLLFWSLLQQLHDTDSYWSESGITEDGANYAKEIITRF